LFTNREYGGTLGKNRVKKEGKGDAEQDSIHRGEILNR
jgi:hypothetical protein